MSEPQEPLQKPLLLPRISVNRPVTVTMCLLALLVIGAVAYSRIGVQLFPSGFTPKFLWVNIRYRNATPQEVEQQLARPLEETLKTVKGIKRIRTYSGSWGVGAPLEFRQDADMTLAYNQVMDRLERLKPSLPQASRDNVWVWKFNEEGDQEIMWIGVAIDSTIVDPYLFMQTHVVRRLERIDGVAKVDAWGVHEKELMIEVDQDRMQARGVSTYELVNVLQKDNFSLAGGYVHEAGKRFFVRSLARYRSLEEIQNVVIRTRNGNVRLREVADVVYDIRERGWHQRINGRPAASIEIKRESGANIVEVCERVVAALEEMEQEPITSQLAFNVFFNQGQFIDESIGNLRNTAAWGGLFAAMILFFYLRAIRMTAIITLAIPLCVMITLSALYFIDWSLNLITMMGLMVGIGMVVDNAIVILENIYRRRAMGESPRVAAVTGASEVGLAITMATLTTVVVFLPLILMGGDAELSFYLSRIGVPVIVALVGSLLVALLFVPQAAVRFGGGRVRPDPPSIVRARRMYERALNWSLRRRRDALLIVIAVFATILYPMDKVKKTDSMRGNINDIRIRVHSHDRLPKGSLEQVMEELESFLDGRNEAYGIRTMRVAYWRSGGYLHVFLDSDPNQAWWYVAYRDLRSKIGYPVDGRMERQGVIEDLRVNLPKFVGYHIGVDRWGGGGRDPSISVYLYGDDTETLADLSVEAERRIKDIPWVVSVDTDLEREAEEVQILVNRERAHRFGISAQTVGRSIAYGLQGVSLPRYQRDGREVRTRVYLNDTDRQTVGQLRQFTFSGSSGESVPLSSLATLRIAPGSGTIRREDGKTRLRIRAFTTRGDVKALYQELDRVMSGMRFPRGYSWDKGERYSRFRESDESMLFASILAITCVFLLMGVLFESFLLPFSVLFSIPFAFLGVYWILYLTNTPWDMMANIGLIVLIGLVVNNAIVLVDMVNRLRASGLSRDNALLEAARNRFRPILMTTFTTIFGLLPLAAGNSNLIGIPYAPLGRTMMGGLLSSTFLTLFVVPLFYTYLDDFRAALARISSNCFGPRPKAGPAYSEAADDD